MFLPLFTSCTRFPFAQRKAERYAASHYDLVVGSGISVWVSFLIWFWTMCLENCRRYLWLLTAEAIRLKVNITIGYFVKNSVSNKVGSETGEVRISRRYYRYATEGGCREFEVQEGRIDLERKKLIVAEISLEEGDVFEIGAGTVEDTVQSNPLWIGDRSQADKDPGRRLSHVYRGVASYLGPE